MNRCLYILLIAIITNTLYGAQIGNKSEILLLEHWSYVFGSGNTCTQSPLTYKQLENRCNKPLQNRPLVGLSIATQRQEPFLVQDYIWEKIGKPNHPDQYFCTKPIDGCIRWHQIYRNSAPIEQSSHNTNNIPTVEQLKVTKKRLQNKSKLLRQRYEKALNHEHSLLIQETLSIIKPIAALVQINKSEKQHELYLQNSQKRYHDLKTTSQDLRKQIPLDIQDYLKKNPETWNSLKLLANIEEQEARLAQEKMREEEAYTSLQQDKASAKDQLQAAWLQFDQVAMSNTILAQHAYAEKRKLIMNTQPNNPINITTVELTNEEIADYICTYKVKTVLANVINKEEQDILASTYPTAIPPCIKGSHAQQLFLHDPALGLIEAAKKILLQKALQTKRTQFIEQNPTIPVTSIHLTQEEKDECLRIWNISEILKKIATEQQLKDITQRFPHYTLKITEHVIKPKESENTDNQETSALENEQDLNLNSSYDSVPDTGSSSWSIGSLISW